MRSASCSRAADEPVTACGLDHQGESVLAWDADTGRPLTPIVTWQDKRSQEVLDRLEAAGRGEEVPQAQRNAARPVLLGGQARVAARARRGRRSERSRRGTLRMGTVDSFLCDRLGAGFATDPSTASRTQLGAPEWDPALLELFGVPRGCCRRSPTPWAISARSATSRGPQELPLRARCVDQQAALAGSRLRAARASSRRRTGPACSCSPTPATQRPVAPAGACCRPWPGASNGRVEWAIDGGVFTAGALLEWLSRDLGLAADPAALAGGRGDGRGRRAASGCCPRWRASARRGGSRTRGR